MKVLGYIDDALTYWINWQKNIGVWNLLLIPLELIICYYVSIYIWIRSSK